MRTTVTVLALSVVALPAAAQSCKEWGNQTTCYGGPTVNHYGNSNIPRGDPALSRSPANGATFTRNNPAAPTQRDQSTPAFGSGPTGLLGTTVAQPEGTTLVLPDGRTATRRGNTTTFSDGRICQHNGNATACN